MGAELISIGIIEDHWIYRDGLVRVVESAADLELVSVVTSVEEFAEAGSSPQVVLLDLRLPGGGRQGLGALEYLVDAGYIVLVLTGSEETLTALGALAAGARGYLTKSVRPEELLAAVRIVATGRAYIGETQMPEPTRRHPVARLSRRQSQILILLADGLTDAAIADTLGIGVKAVRTQLDRIRDKTGARRRVELARWAIDQGLAVSTRLV